MLSFKKMIIMIVFIVIVYPQVTFAKRYNKNKIMIGFHGSLTQPKSDEFNFFVKNGNGFGLLATTIPKGSVCGIVFINFATFPKKPILDDIGQYSAFTSGAGLRMGSFQSRIKIFAETCFTWNTSNSISYTSYSQTGNSTYNYIEKKIGPEEKIGSYGYSIGTGISLKYGSIGCRYFSAGGHIVYFSYYAELLIPIEF